MGREPEIRTYVLRDGGELEAHSILPVSYYGTCPNIGDTIYLSWNKENPELYSVQRRYFLDNRDGKEG